MQSRPYRYMSTRKKFLDIIVTSGLPNLANSRGGKGLNLQIHIQQLG